MNEFEFEVLDLEEEEIIEKANLERFDFPAVYVGDHAIYFNKRCKGCFDTEYIQVSKSTNFICFRSNNAGYKRSASSRNPGFTISGRHIRDVTALPAGKSFRLYKLKDGGYAIKRYEPIDES